MKPSEALDAGKCPACLGEGTLYVIVDRKRGTCAVCGGEGTADAMWDRLAEPEPEP